MVDKSFSDQMDGRTVHDSDLLLQFRVWQKQPQESPNIPQIPILLFFFLLTHPFNSKQTIIVCIHELSDFGICKAGCQSIGTFPEQEISGNIQTEMEEQVMEMNGRAILGDCLDQMLDMFLKHFDVANLCSHETRSQHIPRVLPSIVVQVSIAILDQGSGIKKIFNKQVEDSSRDIRALHI